VTAVELDEDLASALAERVKGCNVEVINADAASVQLPSNRFSAAASFSMLHHIPSPEKQDQVFAEVCRLLRPGGVFIATDSRDLEAIRAFHTDDVFVPLDPVALPDRLVTAGFTEVSVEAGEYELRFHAGKPAGSRDAI
jgi:ubiquinone/menaquinone biosynthesis C-methylase UbiE